MHKNQNVSLAVNFFYSLESGTLIYFILSLKNFDSFVRDCLLKIKRLLKFKLYHIKAYKENKQ